MKNVQLTQDEIGVILTAIEEYDYRTKKKIEAEKLNDNSKTFPYYEKKLKILNDAKVVLRRILNA